MKETDTIRLLRECDAGAKMAVSSIDEVLEKVSGPGLKRLLQESREHHEKLENEIHSLLKNYGSQEKEPAAIAKGMSWMKTNMKMSMDDSDATVADLITDGCNMGTKSLSRYLNQYRGADHASRELCGRLISIEEKLCSGMRQYL
ncbi:MAG TPA: hypothetical protein H9761_19540 [Candidatus Eisenbergiella merdavium]|uniref:DUF2383 domain-containing protein n=1 Tax=Candidatus Eisenbergiella merdavium TaxID=2838551 RepID=A0A9D2NK22_9FIRM|nr:hypothetical protein [Candidatus Eisenbergiella merdavium]